MNTIFREKSRWLITVLMLLFLQTAFGQTKHVTGQVCDNEGIPVVGASVIIEGTLTGAITDENGDFSLEAPDGSTLVVEFLGFKEQKVTVTSARSRFDITLEPEYEYLDDVVVVGYGAVKKSDLTGSVASVKMQSINDIPASSVDGLLQGRAAGLQVMNNSQDPGASSIIRIRGNSSINGSNTPLVVVNGFPMGDAGNLSQINLTDIESVEVLKDASASAIYGSRGANGVILITTKEAEEGITTVTAKHQTVISQLSDPIDVWYDPMLMAQVANEEQVNAGYTPPYIGAVTGGIYYPSLMEIQNGEWSNTDWVDLCLRTPIINSTTLSVNSAGKKASINANVNYYDDQGIYKNDGYSRLNGNVRFRYNLFIIRIGYAV